MKATKPTTMRPAPKATKRREPQRGSSRKRIISRAGALARARRHVLNRMFKGAAVRDGEEARINAYNVRRKDTWVVYKNLKHRADEVRAEVIGRGSDLQAHRPGAFREFGGRRGMNRAGAFFLAGRTGELCRE